MRRTLTSKSQGGQSDQSELAAFHPKGNSEQARVFPLPGLRRLLEPKGDLEMATKKGKRELINTGRDKRFVKRNADGTFKESDDVGKSLAADVRRKAKTKVKAGYGDQGDQPKRAAKKSTKKAAKRK
jgi:hypothetical protein